MCWSVPAQYNDQRVVAGGSFGVIAGHTSPHQNVVWVGLTRHSSKHQRGVPCASQRAGLECLVVVMQSRNASSLVYLFQREKKELLSLRLRVAIADMFARLRWEWAVLIGWVWLLWHWTVDLATAQAVGARQMMADMDAGKGLPSTSSFRPSPSL